MYSARLDPCRGFASPDGPLPLSTKICRPSRLNIAAVGYQPVGMKPSTWLFHGVATSTTATALLSALATSSCVSSRDRLTWFGVEPGGASFDSATEICSTAREMAAVRMPGEPEPRVIERQRRPHVPVPDIDDGDRRQRVAVVRDEQRAAVRRLDHRQRQIADRDVAAGRRDLPPIRKQRDAVADRARVAVTADDRRSC
jgi:hypothetical protein